MMSAIPWTADIIGTGKAPLVFGVPTVVHTSSELEHTTGKYDGLLVNAELASIRSTKRPVTFQNYEDPIRSLSGVVCSERYALLVVEGNAIVKMHET